MKSLVELQHTIKDCRDEKENFLLETAIRGKADYIVTGDKDLLVLNPYRGKEIIGFKEFENIIKAAKR
jgi:uncharacterized protein